MAAKTYPDYIRHEVSTTLTQLMQLGTDSVRRLEEIGIEIDSIDVELDEYRHPAIEINFHLTEEQAIDYGYSRSELAELKGE